MEGIDEKALKNMETSEEGDDAWTGQEVGDTSKERSITDLANDGCVGQDQHAGNHHGVWGGKDSQEGGGDGGGAEHLRPRGGPLST